MVYNTVIWLYAGITSPVKTLFCVIKPVFLPSIIHLYTNMNRLVSTGRVTIVNNYINKHLQKLYFNVSLMIQEMF